MAPDRLSPFGLEILPRQSMPWERFLLIAPPKSIALDGVVSGGPNFDETELRINFDHHDGVVREATMSTCMQVFFAIKGGLMHAFAPGARGRYGVEPTIFINDTDSDTALAVWLLVHHKQLEGVQSLPHINRLLALTDRWDVTGGAFPMNLSDELVEQHNWVFAPYAELRNSGGLSRASVSTLRDNLETILSRLGRFMMGSADRLPLDTRHTILYSSPRFMVVEEVGGPGARYDLFSQGMNAFVSLVARREDGRNVYSIGRRSRFIPFPVPELYRVLNQLEELDQSEGWGGSDIVGGSSRIHGSKLTWEEIRDVVESYLSPQILG